MHARSWVCAVLAASFLSVLPLSSATRSAQTGNRLRFDRALAGVDALAREQMARVPIGGLTVGVVANGHLAWTRSYGFADMERHERASRESVYRIGSITKQFTAVMLLRLVDRGVVRLSDNVERYLPAIDTVRREAAGTAPVTLYELATMTSGLAEEPDDVATYTHGDLEHWEDVLTVALGHTKLEHEPGTAWAYSNIGYAALGASLAHAAGRSYPDYVRAEILAPLGMDHSGFELTEAMHGRLATGYASDGGKLDVETPRRELQGRGYKVPNGGLYSTVDDLASFVTFEMGGGPASVLGAASRKANLEHLAWASADLAQGYGIGVHVVRRGHLVAFGHPGSVAGYLSAAYFDPKTGSGVIVLRNTDDKRFDVLDVCLRMLDMIAGAQPARAGGSDAGRTR